MNNPRKHTNKLHNMLDDGRIGMCQVIDMCLKYMSDTDVGAMCSSNDIDLDDNSHLYEETCTECGFGTNEYKEYGSRKICEDCE